jgi:ParB family transcriptional regulator, chromosome partitioning protein
MRMPWSKPRTEQLDLLGLEPVAPHDAHRQASPNERASRSPKAATRADANAGHPLLVPLDQLCEDPNNPRTEFPQAEIEELANSIRQHGILQPLVVAPADANGSNRIHHGAKRYRAARLAGLSEVPVVVSDAPTDPYAQAAENQKRHGLTPMDLARLIRKKSDAGDSNATIAKLLGIDQTTIAHHLALLDLPPDLNDAMQAGRCTSPRTLYELKKLHHDQPERVRALLDGADVRAKAAIPRQELRRARPQAALLARAEAICARLEKALDHVAHADPRIADNDLQPLKQRLASLADRLA